VAWCSTGPCSWLGILWLRRRRRLPDLPGLRAGGGGVWHGPGAGRAQAAARQGEAGQRQQRHEWAPDPARLLCHAGSGPPQRMSLRMRTPCRWVLLALLQHSARRDPLSGSADAGAGLQSELGAGASISGIRAVSCHVARKLCASTGVGGRMRRMPPPASARGKRGRWCKRRRSVLALSGWLKRCVGGRRRARERDRAGCRAPTGLAVRAHCARRRRADRHAGLLDLAGAPPARTPCRALRGARTPARRDRR